MCNLAEQYHITVPPRYEDPDEECFQPLPPPMSPVATRLPGQLTRTLKSAGDPKRRRKIWNLGIIYYVLFMKGNLAAAQQFTIGILVLPILCTYSSLPYILLYWLIAYFTHNTISDFYYPIQNVSSLSKISLNKPGTFMLWVIVSCLYRAKGWRFAPHTDGRRANG